MRLAVSLSALMINVERATCTPAQADEGTLTATFAQMDDDEASQMAQAIGGARERLLLVVYCVDEEREAWRALVTTLRASS